MQGLKPLTYTPFVLNPKIVFYAVPGIRYTVYVYSADGFAIYEADEGMNFSRVDL